MKCISLFSDASVNFNKATSVGCFTLVDLDLNNDNNSGNNCNNCNNNEVDINNNEVDVEKLDIKLIVFEGTSSTMAELITIKEALEYVSLYITEQLSKQLKEVKTVVYVDCLNFVKLINQRQYEEKLKKHRNYEFYKELIDIVNSLNIEIIWSMGHIPTINQTTTQQKIFSKIDKVSRKISRKI